MKTIKTISLITILAVAFIAPTSIYAQESPKLSDVEIAHVAVIANQIDIVYARIAEKRSTNKEILKFAETMVNDHSAVIEQASALVKKLGVTPKDNAVSQQLLKDSEKTKISLNKESQHNFDQAYVDNEVNYHKAVIAAIEDLLIPQTKNSDLKELLQNVLPALKAHLGHAEMVQKQLRG